MQLPFIRIYKYTIDMKIIFNLIFVLSLLLHSQCGYGQDVSFDCEKFSKRNLLTVQQRYKDSAFFSFRTEKSSGKKVEVYSYLIDELSYDDLKQLCIEAWYDVKQNGADYCYERFCRRYFKITRLQYMLDVQYLEILVKLDRLIKDAR